jgi:hypothetical protein
MSAGSTSGIRISHHGLPVANDQLPLNIVCCLLGDLLTGFLISPRSFGSAGP